MKRLWVHELRKSIPYYFSFGNFVCIEFYDAKLTATLYGTIKCDVSAQRIALPRQNAKSNMPRSTWLRALASMRASCIIAMAALPLSIFNCRTHAASLDAVADAETNFLWHVLRFDFGSAATLTFAHLQIFALNTQSQHQFIDFSGIPLIAQIACNCLFFDDILYVLYNFLETKRTKRTGLISDCVLTEWGPNTPCPNDGRQRWPTHKHIFILFSKFRCGNEKWKTIAVTPQRIQSYTVACLLTSHTHTPYVCDRSSVSIFMHKLSPLHVFIIRRRPLRTDFSFFNRVPPFVFRPFFTEL